MLRQQPEFVAGVRVGWQVLLVPGLVMGAGQWLGARAGAGMVIRHGTRFIRPVFLVVVLALTAKLLFAAYVR